MRLATPSPVGVTVASESVPSLYCSCYITPFFSLLLQQGVKFILYVVKLICFVRLEFNYVSELSIIIWIMGTIVVIIDQGYTIYFGGFIMDVH